MAAPSGIPYTGTGSSDPLGSGRELLSEVLYFSGCGGDVGTDIIIMEVMSRE